MSRETIIKALHALGCDPARGTSWTVRCPLPTHGKGRGDKDPSLSVKLDHRGLGVFCPLCKKEAILAHLGLTYRDLFFEHDDPPRPDLAELEERYRRGELKPLSLETMGTRDMNVTRDIASLPHASCDNNASSDVPAEHRLGATARKVLEDMQFLWGLFAAVGETRPLPYSTRFCAKRMGWDDQAGYKRASRTLSALEKMGYIVCVEVLPPRGKPYGTKCYAAGGLARTLTLTNGARAVNLGEPSNRDTTEDITQQKIRQIIRDSLKVA